MGVVHDHEENRSKERVNGTPGWGRFAGGKELEMWLDAERNGGRVGVTKLESEKVRVGFNRKKGSQEQVGLRTPERLAEPDHSAADSESCH